jgi:predicted Zn-dependent protease
MSPRATVVLALGLGLGLAACAGVMDALESVTPEDSAVGKAVRGANRVRKSFQDLDPSEEHFIGRSVAATVLTMPGYKLSTDGALTDYVNEVGCGIVASCDQVRGTFAGYHFAVLETDQINAFACPGGTVFVTRGLLKKTTSEDELAGVLAHEIAHVTLRHGLAAINQANLMEGLSYLGSSAAQATLSKQDLQKVTGIFHDSIHDIVTTMVTNGYSKSAEFESDRSGESFAAAAGYDPNGLSRVIARMKDGTGGHGGMMSTHPAPDDRLHELGLERTWSRDELGIAARAARFKRVLAG